MWKSSRKILDFLKSSTSLIISPLSSAPIPKVSGQAVGKKRWRLPTETDPQKLINHCCGANYFKDGDEIKLGPDEEYPEWLWKLPLVPPKLHELDPNTKEYWEKAQIVGRQREWKLRSITNKRHMNLNPTAIERAELKYRRRFRALAKYHYNAGYDIVEHHEREDIWNLHEKDRYYIPEDPSKKFYPGMDRSNYRPIKFKRQKARHFGQ